MTPEEVLNYLWNGLLTLVIGVTGWFVRDTITQHRRLREDHNAHKIEVAKEYATKEELIRVENGLKETLNRLEDKIDKLLEGKR